MPPDELAKVSENKGSLTIEPAMTSSHCKQCDQPLVEIDNYGERLIGCIECNRWTWRGSKRPIELPEDDLEALKVVDSVHDIIQDVSVWRIRSCASNQQHGEQISHGLRKNLLGPFLLSQIVSSELQRVDDFGATSTLSVLETRDGSKR
jgi:uncharacterized Zn finger protein (UPF0148 family)